MVIFLHAACYTYSMNINYRDNLISLALSLMVIFLHAACYTYEYKL